MRGEGWKVLILSCHFLCLLSLSFAVFLLSMSCLALLINVLMPLLINPIQLLSTYSHP
jgi:hypothetical protein